MTAKPSDNPQWSDSKDYGLPYVEISPLPSMPASSRKKVEDEKNINEIKPEVQIAKIDTKVSSNAKKDKTESNKNKKTEFIEPIFSSDQPAKNKVNRWVWIAVVSAIAIISFIILQTQNLIPGSKLKIDVIEESVSVQNPLETNSESLKNVASQEIQVINNQNVVSDSVNIPNPLSQSLQNGTTIESGAAGTLIRIESKKTSPQYFIVVGSLPNEALAVKVAAKYYDRVGQVYLISPYEEAGNYRLGIGTYGSFSSASEELSRIKNLYTEDLWILKY
jgi:hypothetical protein